MSSLQVLNTIFVACEQAHTRDFWENFSGGATIARGKLFFLKRHSNKRACSQARN